MLNLDVSLFVVFAIVWILLFILKKLYFNPVTDLISSRDNEVESNLKISQDSLDSHEKNIVEIEQKLKTARAAARETKGTFISEAQKEKDNIVAEMIRESRLRVDKANEELAAQLEGIKQELEAESEILSEKIEQRLLDR
jgi:F0F1-type ATP synthase membrane subunit b/b'